MTMQDMLGKNKYRSKESADSARTSANGYQGSAVMLGGIFTA
jgi:hypothetical protein